jgi:hypothetical protein
MTEAPYEDSASRLVSEVGDYKQTFAGYDRKKGFSISGTSDSLGQVIRNEEQQAVFLKVQKIREELGEFNYDPCPPHYLN